MVTAQEDKPMATITQVSGSTEKNMDKDLSLIKMEISTSAHGSATRKKALESCNTTMDHDTKACGKKTSDTETVP